ncbi:MAG: hypothetical protein AAFY46_12940 [Planctomycetota bacterium]
MRVIKDAPTTIFWFQRSRVELADIPLWTVIVPMAVQLVAAVIVWTLAARIAVEPDSDRSPGNDLAWLHAAVGLIGLVIIVGTLLHLVNQEIGWSMLQRATADTGLNLPEEGKIVFVRITSAIELVVGFGLLLGRARIAGMLRKMRYAGVVD